MDPEVSAYASDSCDEAVAAARRVAEALGPFVSRIYLRPGVFDCDNFWPGVSSAGLCPMSTLLPGVTMRGWIAFSNDDRVAAVSLHRTPPSDPAEAVAAAWKAETKAFAVPPAGWNMP